MLAPCDKAKYGPGMFHKGDAVSVFSRSLGIWIRDGIVMQRQRRPTTLESGLHLPAGSVKVLYDESTSVKWIQPAAFDSEIRKADFLLGDRVSVFCRGKGLWIADGVIVEVLSEPTVVEGGLQMSAGAVKVVYDSKSSAKWVGPDNLEGEIRPVRGWLPEDSEEDEDSTADSEAGMATSRNIEVPELPERLAAPKVQCWSFLPKLARGLSGQETLSAWSAEHAPLKSTGSASSVPIPDGADAVTVPGSDAAPEDMDCDQQDMYAHFAEGDAVCIFSRGDAKWLRDGVVVAALAEDGIVDGGVQMPAGSVKVLYERNGRSKWIPPASFGEEIRKADFQLGDRVSVFCRGKGLFVSDGVIVQVLAAPAVVEGGLGMPEGAVKVIYESGSSTKWIPPESFDRELDSIRDWVPQDLIDGGADTWEVVPPPSGNTGLQKQTASTPDCCFAFLFLRRGPQAPKADEESEDDYTVSGLTKQGRGLSGRYLKVGVHNEMPKYKNRKGCIIYFDGYWKLNGKDDVLHWSYGVRGAHGELPPSGAWQPFKFSTEAPLSVQKASDVELFHVSGLAWAGAIGNGRYVEVGSHNDRPFYTNNKGAAIYFDGYWKLNFKGDKLAWQYGNKSASGQEPPFGAWAPHWSHSANTGEPTVRACGNRPQTPLVD